MDQTHGFIRLWETLQNIPLMSQAHLKPFDSSRFKSKPTVLNMSELALNFQMIMERYSKIEWNDWRIDTQPWFHLLFPSLVSTHLLYSHLKKENCQKLSPQNAADEASKWRKSWRSSTSSHGLHLPLLANWGKSPIDNYYGMVWAEPRSLELANGEAQHAVPTNPSPPRGKISLMKSEFGAD